MLNSGLMRRRSIWLLQVGRGVTMLLVNGGGGGEEKEKKEKYQLRNFAVKLL